MPAPVRRTSKKDLERERRGPVPSAPGDAAAADGAYHPPYIAAGLVALGVWLLYAITLAPTTAFWDTSEYIATAHILGIPHPPGNPSFVVLARAWELLLAPFGLEVAVRINLFSATMSALAHGFWFLMVHRILSFYSDDRTFRIVGAVAAVVISATAFTVWNQSNVNEKVYTVSLFTIALLSWLAFRWRDNLGGAKDHHLILLGVYILAFSVGNHLMAFLAAPALFLFILLVEPKILGRWRLYAGAVLVTVLGLSINLFMPLRAALDPVINEVDPSTMDALWAALTRQQYDKPSMFATPWDPGMPRGIALLAHQIGNYLQYFDWQWARSVVGNDPTFGGLRPLFTLLFMGLGIHGAVTHYRRDRTSWAYVAGLFAVLSGGLVFYLNFKYGYSWRRDLFPNMELHEVRERDYFFIVSFSIWGLWCGVGLAAIWQTLSERLRARTASPRRALAFSSPVLALALIPLALNWTWADRSYDYAARDWAYNLLQSVEPYSVLITNGDNDTFPLWYLQEVEGIRRDVQVIVMSYLNTPWYVKQIKQLTTPCPPEIADPEEVDETRIICQRRYDAEMGPAFYAADLVQTDAPGQAVAADAPPGRRAPRESIIQLTEAQIDQVANSGYFQLPSDQRLQAGNIQTTLPRGTLMLPADVFLTSIIMNAMDDRPIYFATTTQAYNELNLGDYLLRQGVAYRLMDGLVEEDLEEGIVAMPAQLAPVTGQHLDLPRTDSLLLDVFQHRGGIPDDWGHWVDAATQGIPFYYAYTHLAAAQAHSLLGNQEMVQRHQDRAEAWLELGQR